MKVCDCFLGQGVDCIVSGCPEFNAVFHSADWKGIIFVANFQVLTDKIIYESGAKDRLSNIF